MSNKYYLDKLEKFLGGKIVGIITDPGNEFFGLQIKPIGGKEKNLWFLMDDEGNGPGSFEIEEA